MGNDIHHSADWEEAAIDRLVDGILAPPQTNLPQWLKDDHASLIWLRLSRIAELTLQAIDPKALYRDLESPLQDCASTIHGTSQSPETCESDASLPRFQNAPLPSIPSQTTRKQELPGDTLPASPQDHE